MGLGLALMLAAAATPSAAADIRINQVGFQPGLPHRAIVPDSASGPQPWALTDRTGKVVARGVTQPFGPDRDSGENVHRILFDAGNGSGYRLKVGGHTSRPFSVAASVYDRLPFAALNYFYQNRAGTPIEARYAGGAAWARPAGHPGERATCVAGKDSKGNDWKGCPYTLDVAGGWYDAGDHGKYIVNGGIALWTLQNVYERQQALGHSSTFRDGKAALPEAGNRIDDLLDEARWEVKFFLKMQVPDGTHLDLPVGIKRTAANMAFTRVDASGMVHHKVASEQWTAVPMPPQLDRLKRQLFPPSTAATLNFAATMAQCARIWRSIDPALSARCLSASEKAWAAARRNPEIYAVADFTGSGGYGDGKLSDEFYWAAAELYATTGKPDYLALVRASPLHLSDKLAEPNWGSTATLGAITLAVTRNGLTGPEQDNVRSALIGTADRFLADTSRTGYAIPYAPERWPWGSTSSVLNRAMILGLAADYTKDAAARARYRQGVTDAMDFILGRNPLDTSFVSGFGARSLRNPHHRFWANMLDPKLPPAPPGALSGGPNNSAMSDPIAVQMRGKCAPMKCWADDTRAYALNEVAVNWNAPLVWVSAWLTERK